MPDLYVGDTLEYPDDPRPVDIFETNIRNFCEATGHDEASARTRFENSELVHTEIITWEQRPTRYRHPATRRPERTT